MEPFSVICNLCKTCLVAGMAHTMVSGSIAAICENCGKEKRLWIGDDKGTLELDQKFKEIIKGL